MASCLNDSCSPAYEPQDIGSKLVAASIAVIVLDVIFVSLRLVSRRLGGIKEGWDGVFLYPALLLNIFTCVETLGKSFRP